MKHGHMRQTSYEGIMTLRSGKSRLAWKWLGHSFGPFGRGAALQVPIVLPRVEATEPLALSTGPFRSIGIDAYFVHGKELGRGGFGTVWQAQLWVGIAIHGDFGMPEFNMFRRLSMLSRKHGSQATCLRWKACQPHISAHGGLTPLGRRLRRFSRELELMTCVSSVCRLTLYKGKLSNSN